MKAKSSPKPKTPRVRAPRKEMHANSRPTAAPQVGTVQFNKEDLARLENWSCTQRDPFLDPRMAGNLLLQGNVYNHPDVRFKDGEHILTSAVVSFEGRFITTQSRVYYVGEADPAWLVWLKSQGRIFYPDNPLYYVKHPNDAAAAKPKAVKPKAAKPKAPRKPRGAQ